MPSQPPTLNEEEYGSTKGPDSANDKGRAAPAEEQFRAAEQLARAGKIHARILKYKRTIPHLSGQKWAFHAQNSQHARIDCQIELLPSRETLELVQVLEAVPGEEEPGGELTLQRGLRPGDHIKLNCLSKRCEQITMFKALSTELTTTEMIKTCQWKRMTQYDMHELYDRICHQRQVLMGQQLKCSSPATELHKKANEAFKSRRFEQSVSLFTQAIKAVMESTDLTADIQRAQLAVVHSNRAQAFLEQSNVSQALSDCDAALKYDEWHVRSLLRRAAIYIMHRGTDNKHAINDWKGAAMRDLQLALVLEPNNQQAKDRLQQLCTMPAPMRY